MLREFKPEDAVTPRFNMLRTQALRRLLDLHGNTTDYWLSEVVADWEKELRWRLAGENIG